ncbi:metallophosphoesterase [Ammoniphilus sp. 3BR4]|uniref:metallophosphoesterase n=1 Tax=Ammoniphilus sp. 3BR4 TaxID=3158265 RepID=UPI0034661D13
MKFVHAADLHLDTPFVGLSQLPPLIREQIQESTFQSYQRLIDFCIEEQVDFLLLSGDIYNSSDRSLRAQLRFKEGLEKLASFGISSYVIHGNHDPLDGYRARLTWPEQVHFFGGEEVEAIPHRKQGRELARIYGISYLTNHVTDNLAKRFQREPHDSYAIGLLHANVEGMAAHGNYAPCTLEELQKTGMDYWALGHIHKRQVLRKGSPAIVYPGNLQARSFKETGEKGCYLVQVDSLGDFRLTFQATDNIRWYDAAIDLGMCQTEQDFLEAMDEQMADWKQQAQGRSVIARLTVLVTKGLAQIFSKQGMMSDLLERYREINSPFFWLQTIQLRTSSSSLADDPFLMEMQGWIDRMKQDPELQRKLLQEAQGPLMYEHRLGSKWLSELCNEDGEWAKELEMLLVQSDKGEWWK